MQIGLRCGCPNADVVVLIYENTAGLDRIGRAGDRLARRERESRDGDLQPTTAVVEGVGLYYLLLVNNETAKNDSRFRLNVLYLSKS